jgi:hypothetical protein
MCLLLAESDQNCSRRKACKTRTEPSGGSPIWWGKKVRIGTKGKASPIAPLNLFLTRLLSRNLTIIEATVSAAREDLLKLFLFTK